MMVGDAHAEAISGKIRASLRTRSQPWITNANPMTSVERPSSRMLASSQTSAPTTAIAPIRATMIPATIRFAASSN